MQRKTTFVRMKMLTKYWAFQCIGWGLFCWLNIYINYITEQSSIKEISLNILLSILGIFITHKYRGFILEKNWRALATEQLLKKTSIAILLLALLYIMCYYFIMYVYNMHHTINIATLVGTYISSLFLFIIWNCIYFFWTYIEQNRNLQIDTMNLLHQKKDLEIQTIKANLQPHFIFNSLNSIRALINENPVLARTSITQLSNILRTSISNETALIPLQKELEIVRDYLSLEKIRFEERIQYNEQIQPQTLPLLVPAMMLQTLVENAVKHGISALPEGGIITLRTNIHNDVFSIEIINTGTLKKEIDKSIGVGFGLNSTKQRLHLLDSKATVQIFEEQKEVHVLIQIPIENK